MIFGLVTKKELQREIALALKAFVGIGNENDASLREQLGELRESSKTNGHDINVLLNKVSALEQALNTLASQANTIYAENQKLKEEVKALKASNLEGQLKTLGDDLYTARYSIRKLEEELESKAKRNNTHVNDAVKNARERLSHELVQQTKSFRERIEALENHLPNVDGSKLGDKLQEIFNESIDKMTESYRKLGEVVATLSGEMNDVTFSVDKLKTKVESQSKRTTELKAALKKSGALEVKEAPAPVAEEPKAEPKVKATKVTAKKEVMSEKPKRTRRVATKTAPEVPLEAPEAPQTPVKRRRSTKTTPKA